MKNFGIILNIDEQTEPFVIALVEAIKKRASTDSQNSRLKNETYIVIYVSEEWNNVKSMFRVVYLSDIDHSKNKETFDTKRDVHDTLTKAIEEGKVTIRLPCACGCSTGFELADFSLKNQKWDYQIHPPM